MAEVASGVGQTTRGQVTEEQGRQEINLVDKA